MRRTPNATRLQLITAISTRRARHGSHCARDRTSVADRRRAGSSSPRATLVLGSYVV